MEHGGEAAGQQRGDQQQQGGEHSPAPHLQGYTQMALYCTVLFCTAHYLDGDCVGGGRGEVPQHAPGHAPHQPQDQGPGERPAHRAVRGQQHRVLQPLPRRF